MAQEKSGIRYPRGEILWTSHCDISGNLVAVTTSKPARDYYYLYEFSGGVFTRLGKAASPLDVEKKYQISKRMGCK